MPGPTADRRYPARPRPGPRSAVGTRPVVPHPVAESRHPGSGWVAGSPRPGPCWVAETRTSGLCRRLFGRLVVSEEFRQLPQQAHRVSRPPIVTGVPPRRGVAGRFPFDFSPARRSTTRRSGRRRPGASPAPGLSAVRGCWSSRTVTRAAGCGSPRYPWW